MKSTTKLNDISNEIVAIIDGWRIIKFINVYRRASPLVHVRPEDDFYLVAQFNCRIILF